MTTDPKKSLTPAALSELTKSDVNQLLQTGLGDFSLRELLGLLISTAGTAERSVYLEKEPTDKPNGFYDRSLQLGTIPIEVRVPRTRTGEFRPATLPSRYRRGYSQEVQSLLLGLLGSSRSINAAKDALQKMGLSSSEQDLERVATEMIEELELRNSRPLDPDLLAVFVDGKYIEWREGDKLRSACIYLAIGLGCDGKKRVLSCIGRPGRENLEDWKTVLRGLIERGLRRVMISFRTTSPVCSPSAQASFPMPTSSSALSICSAMPKLISLKPIAPSFNNAGGLSNPPGRWKWAIASSKNFAIVSLKPIQPGWVNSVKSASTIWPS